MGNEIWDDFDDENLVEITSFSAETEKTKTSGKQHEIYFICMYFCIYVLYVFNFKCMYFRMK